MAGNYRAFTERAFDPNRPVCVNPRRTIKAAGRTFKGGEEIDWKRLGISQRRIRQFYDAVWLDHPESDQGRPLDSASPAPAPAPAPTPTPQPSPEPYRPVLVTEPEDDLDQIDDMKALREIADQIGAPYKVSKVDQRAAIREHRESGE